MNHWIHRLHLLSLEELERLKSDPEVGPCQPIQLEYTIKLLMAKMPSLRRELALVLVSAKVDPSGTKSHCVLSDELARVFIKSQATEALTAEVALMCNEIGMVIFRRALIKYQASEEYKAIELSTDELFIHLDRQDAKESAQESAQAFTEDFPDNDRDWLRNHLRETYGLNSPEDWEHLKQARYCIAKENPELVHQFGWKSARRLSKMAFSLYETAKANGCSPGEWLQWKKTRALIRSGKVNPGSIINIPGGGHVWGDGEPVRRDKDGKPRRRAIDIFGNEVAENEATDISAIDRMVQQAYEKQ